MNILFSCIGRRGYIVEYFRDHLGPNDRIIGTSNTVFIPGFKTCDISVLLPDISSFNYVHTLTQLCQEQQVDGLLSFFDPDVDVLSKHLDELSAVGVVPVVPGPDVSNICFNKYNTFLFLKENGFDTPETFLNLEQAISSLDAARVAFPLMVKPCCGFGSHNLFQARNLRELEVFFHYAPDMLIQELLGGDEYHFDICNDIEGQVVSVVPKHKIAMRCGETDQAETSNEPGLIDIGLRLGKELGKRGLVGPLDVDLLIKDNKVFILELNPRFGGGYPLSHLAGADFPRLILKMIRGEPVGSEVGKFKTGLIMMKDYKILTGEKTDFFGAIRNMR